MSEKPISPLRRRMLEDTDVRRRHRPPAAAASASSMMYPVDNTFWTKLKDFIDYEPVSAIDPELRGVLASIGITWRQPFKPTGEAAGTVARGGRDRSQDDHGSLRQLGRPDGRNLLLQETGSK